MSRSWKMTADMDVGVDIKLNWSWIREYGNACGY